jgi:hypothetical protein
MSGYKPLYIVGPQVGLVQNRQNQILPNDAYPILQNMYVYREQLKRKQGCALLGRLQLNIGTTNSSGNVTITIAPLPIQPGIATFNVGTDNFVDQGGSSPVTLLTNSAGTGVLDRATGIITITGSIPSTPVIYIPGLPVMGIRTREINAPNDQTIIFDQNYAYTYNSVSQSYQQFVTVPTTWNKTGEDTTGVSFFWSTNYWVSGQAFSPFSSNNQKLFWETNNTGKFGVNADPPKITDGAKWVSFYSDTLPATNSPWAQIDSSPTYLTNFLAMLPFRSRMVTFNTWEGPNAAGSLQYSNRIRWSTIGNPFIPYTSGPPAIGSWRDDIRGQGGFLDIPTSEDIVSVGFVRDNLVIYCERSTWQLRYTGRSIAPFQIEKVNSELGAESTFCTIQFDTSLVGIGDKGIVECDSYKSERIDIKIPDLVFQFSNVNNGVLRVQGVRDFEKRLAFWTFPLSGKYAPNVSNIFPNQRLVYNYENDSWALFDDSYTSLGTYFIQNGSTWINTPVPWIDYLNSWIFQPVGVISLIGGNQQGFIETLNQYVSNDVSLTIQNIVAGTPTIIRSPNHNLLFESVIEISGILAGDPFFSLNGGVFQVNIIDSNTFTLASYNPDDFEFSIVRSDVPSTPYLGTGFISIRDNFNITSKKFNFAEEGQSIQMGYIDLLMEATGSDNPGAITMNVYLDYNDQDASNTLPENRINNGMSPAIPDTFFNSIIQTNPSNLNTKGGTKFWQRVYCSTRANFLTIQYLFSNAQMAGEEQGKVVQIDAQILWLRQSGRMTQI